jgi:hypothetical protein
MEGNGHVEFLCYIEMDLNQPPLELNIQFSIHNVRFCICLKRETREGLVRRFGEAGYKHILSLSEPLCLAQVNLPQILILILL